jgi:hypothetical protein
LLIEIGKATKNTGYFREKNRGNGVQLNCQSSISDSTAKGEILTQRRGETQERNPLLSVFIRG